MTYRGRAKGKIVELDEPLPYPEGQPVFISVEPAYDNSPSLRGRPSDVIRAMHGPPHLTDEDMNALERSIEEGKQPVTHGGVFDEDSRV